VSFEAGKLQKLKREKIPENCPKKHPADNGRSQLPLLPKPKLDKEPQG
jgi:hypothetical protein